MKMYKYISLGFLALLWSSCNDFLDTTPKDQMPVKVWQTEKDATDFLTGCYDGWEEGEFILYNDCASDFGYNKFPWEGYTVLGDGSVSPTNTGKSFYDFKTIRRCNTFLENVETVNFSDPKVKANMIAQVHAIRAYRYAKLSWWYGGVPIIKDFQSATEAQIPRNSLEDVRTLIHSDIDDYYMDLPLVADKRGYITRGAALAIRLREALYYGDWQVAKDKAKEIIDLETYQLEANYEDLFMTSHQDSKEIIMAVNYVLSTKPLGLIGQMYNAGSNGWSSIVPTHNLVDTYEMANGLTKEETGSGYDPVHPYANRDPRMGKTVFFPGSDFTKQDGNVMVYNSLNQLMPDGKTKNADYYLSVDNSSKTAMTWAKYLNPMSQYSDVWSTSASPIVFRYAEVLLSFAEAENELNGPSTAVYDAIDEVRTRVYMPNVDRTKYSTKEKLRELIQRERAVELAGEGLRRADIVRWKTSDGKMLAEKVMNGPLLRQVGSINVDLSADPFTRATIDVNAPQTERLIENRVFKSYNRYYPIPQGSRDNNPKLDQNEGYN